MEEAELQELRERLARVEARLAKLEGLPAPPRYETPKVPPTTVATPPPIQVPVFLTTETAKPKAPKEDAEYQIGARILPYTGAAVLIIGIAFLVSLAIGRGLITPTMLWWGVNVLSAAFVGVGLWKRDEKEQFGQILTAVGSCGFYLNFAAGHVYQRLYEGETLVGLFVVHSLLNLGYSTWRSSRAFLGLGLLGGIIAALMPLQKNNFEANILLEFLILVPAVIIAARNRWTDASAWIYVIGSLALIPAAVDYRVADELRVSGILGAALLTVAGWAWGFSKRDFDPQGAFGPIALAVSGLVGFLCLRNPMGAYTIIGYAAAIVGLSLIIKNETREKLLLAAALVAFSIAPFGFYRGASPSDFGWTVPILLALSAALALASRRIHAKSASLLAAFDLGLALMVYAIHATDRPIAWSQEVAFLVSACGAIALVSWSLVKAWKEAEMLVLGSYFLSVPLIARMSVLILGSPGMGHGVLPSVAMGLGFAALGAAFMAYRSRWDSAVILLWSIYLVGLFCYGVSLADRPSSLSFEISLLATFGMCAGVAGYVSGIGAGEVGRNRYTAWSLSAIIGGLLVIRLSTLLLTRAPIELRVEVAGLLGAGVVALACALASLRWRIVELGIVSALFSIGSIIFYGNVVTESVLPFGQDLLTIGVLLGAVVFGGVALMRSSAERALAIYGSSSAAWILLSRLGYLVLTEANFAIKTEASVSIAWTITGLLLIIIGFAAHVKELRYMSFVVFGSTLVKVLMVDLVGLDPILRVVILMLLGLVMLAGGYWYIRVLKPTSQ